MSRPPREFRAESFELEGRLLLAIGHASIPVNEYVQFESLTSPGLTSVSTPPTQVVAVTTEAPARVLPLTSRSTLPTHVVAVTTEGPTRVLPLTSGSTPRTQVVGQQDRVATVMLTRSDNRGRLQVQVTTDRSSPAVGVNVGAVDQTVTFPNYQGEAAVTVPILAGAPNPGEVDVNLTMTPITPNVTTTSAPLVLRVLASDATLPPKIVSVQGAPQGIVLTFSKPMNPVGASNVNNYALSWTTTHSKHNDLGVFALLFPWSDYSTSSGLVRLQSAQYDPATNSVTLIAKRKHKYSFSTGLTVSQGHPAKTSGRPGDQSNLGQGLTDLEGNPINVDTTPGKFRVFVGVGTQRAL